MREAYTLLRQSIIHVEQDDIDFDEEELEGERDDGRQRAAAADPTDDVDGDQDVEMSAAEMEAMDQMEESSMGINGVRVTGAAAGLAAASSSSRASSAAAGADAVPPPPAPKRRMIITHDKYMTLQSLIVLHLSATEREKGRGIDRDELIDWYLELKESEIQDVDELEYEKELITKMLRKLVKVRTACGAIICVLVDHLVGQLSYRGQRGCAGISPFYGRGKCSVFNGPGRGERTCLLYGTSFRGYGGIFIDICAMIRPGKSFFWLVAMLALLLYFHHVQ